VRAVARGRGESPAGCGSAQESDATSAYALSEAQTRGKRKRSESCCRRGPFLKVTAHTAANLTKVTGVWSFHPASSTSVGAEPSGRPTQFRFGEHLRHPHSSRVMRTSGCVIAIGHESIRAGNYELQDRGVMLYEFIALHRAEILRRCRSKVATRSVPPPTVAEMTNGVPRFLDQLTDA
jgi:hypothetical protein